MIRKPSPGDQKVNKTRTLGVLAASVLPRFSGMPTGYSAADALGRTWVAGARSHLAPVLEAVFGLQAAFGSDADSAQAETANPASRLIAACAILLEWLQASAAPRGYEAAEAELGAAVGVFRNAAFAFRGLDEAGPEQHAARAQACQSLLVQGEHHVDSFLAVSGAPGHPT